MIHISQTGAADYRTIQSALDSLSPDNTTEQILFLHAGIYDEQVTVRIPHVTFLGDADGPVVIRHGLSALMPMKDGKKRGTFRTYTCLIDTHDFKASRITFENSSGPGTDVGQAIALYADGDRLSFTDCRFLGGQDTLFTGPLPPKELEPDGFIGPKQFSPRLNGRHYYKNCYIEGDIDFVFGSATAFFDTCTFYSKYTGQPINSYVTAASTPEGQSYGYVMENCRFESNCPPRSAYLGRPWRDHAKTVLINCHMGSHICPEGWHDWNKTQAHDTVFYAEYTKYETAASLRPSWVRRLAPSDLSLYTKEAVLSSGDGWNPWSS